MVDLRPCLFFESSKDSAQSPSPQRESLIIFCASPASRQKENFPPGNQSFCGPGPWKLAPGKGEIIGSLSLLVGLGQQGFPIGFG